MAHLKMVSITCAVSRNYMTTLCIWGGVNFLNVTADSAYSYRWALYGQKIYCCVENPVTANIIILKRINSGNPSPDAVFLAWLKTNVWEKFAVN